MTKFIYKYSPVTYEFIAQEEAYLDPAETKIQGKNIYMLPAWATFEKPSKTKKNQISIFDVSNNIWTVEADFRGMYQVNSDMQPSKVLIIGELPEGYIAITPEQAQIIQDDSLYYIIQDGKLIENPNYETEKLQCAKEIKYNEALIKANLFIENEAIYHFDGDNSIEATDGNIGKFTAFAMGFQTEQFDKVFWTTKEDNIIELTGEDVKNILVGLGLIQSNIWNNQFVAYKNTIEKAQTIEEVSNIEVVYVN